MRSKREVRELAEEAAALHLTNLRIHPGFRRGPGALDEARGFLVPRALAAREEGTVDFLVARGRLRAFFLLAPEPDPYHGVPCLRCLVTYDRRSPRAAAWVVGRLAEALPAVDRPLLFELDGGYHRLLDRLLPLGLHIEALVLNGSPRRALAGLAARGGPRVTPGELGLQVERLRTRRQVDAVIALKRRWFRSRPEFGWFCCAKGFLANERAELLEQLDDPDSDAFVLTEGGRFRGHFGFCVHGVSETFGRNCSMDFLLEPDLHGKGLLTWAYAFLLPRMLRKKVHVFRGGTSQPAVLALGRAMGRPLLAYCLGKGEGHFPREHFDYPPPGRGVPRG